MLKDLLCGLIVRFGWEALFSYFLGVVCLVVCGYCTLPSNQTLLNPTRKNIYKEYRQQITSRISSLDSLHDKNPKAHWSLLEKFKKKEDKDGNTSPISGDTSSGYNYFKDLNISKTTRFYNPSVDAELPDSKNLNFLQN